MSRLDDFLLFKQGAEENPGVSYLPQAFGDLSIKLDIFTARRWKSMEKHGKASNLITDSFSKSDMSRFCRITGCQLPVEFSRDSKQLEVDGLEKTTVGVRFKVFTPGAKI